MNTNNATLIANVLDRILNLDSTGRTIIIAALSKPIEFVALFRQVYDDTLDVLDPAVNGHAIEKIIERPYPVPVVCTDADREAWQKLARDGEKINAIKLFRNVHHYEDKNVGLREAKDIVEAYMNSIHPYPTTL